MKIKKVSIVSFILACFIIIGTVTIFVTSAKTKNNRDLPADYQSLLALKTKGYQNQTVSDFNNTVLNWANQQLEENNEMNNAMEAYFFPENIKYLEKNKNNAASYHFPKNLTNKEKKFLALTIRASNIENAVLIKKRYGNPLIDPDLSFECYRESQEVDKTTWVSLMYGISYHLDPDAVTIKERDKALANAINEIRFLWYHTQFDTLAKMSSDEVLARLKTIAENNSTNAVQISIAENYYLFQTSSMFT